LVVELEILALGVPEECLEQVALEPFQFLPLRVLLEHCDLPRVELLGHQLLQTLPCVVLHVDAASGDGDLVHDRNLLTDLMVQQKHSLHELFFAAF